MVSSLVQSWVYEVCVHILFQLAITSRYSDSCAARTFPALLGYGAALATFMGAFEYTGGSLWGYKKNADIDEFERREQLRKSYRTSGEQTLAELGEGRGMFIKSAMASMESYIIADVIYRSLWPWLRRETGTENQGSIRYRGPHIPGSRFMNIVWFPGLFPICRFPVSLCKITLICRTRLASNFGKILYWRLHCSLVMFSLLISFNHLTNMNVGTWMAA